MKKIVNFFTSDQTLISRLQKMKICNLEIRHNPKVVEVDRDQIVLIDRKYAGRLDLFTLLKPKGCYLVLIVQEDEVEVPFELVNGVVDDVLVQPLRIIDLKSKIQHLSSYVRSADVGFLSLSVQTMITRMQEDIRLSRSIQGHFIPEKFEPISGLKINHKYLSGNKSGGDYLDIFPFEDGIHVGILMSDSTGYGLSSAFMSVILRFAFKYNQGSDKSPLATLRRIYADLKFVMKPNEELSLFYAILNRRTMDLCFANRGGVQFFIDQDLCSDLSAPLKRDEAFVGVERTIHLEPGNRMVLLSDGYSECFPSLKPLLAAQRRTDGVDVINELNFAVKRKLASDDDLPPQDCSVIIIDVQENIIRLARKG